MRQMRASRSQVQQQRERLADLVQDDRADGPGALVNAGRGHGADVLALRR